MTGDTETDQTDTLAQRRAAGIVEALTDEEDTTCSDCGGSVDLSGADTTAEVVEELEKHRQKCDGVWYDDD